jgi:hypothetical protein
MNSFLIRLRFFAKLRLINQIDNKNDVGEILKHAGYHSSSSHSSSSPPSSSHSSSSIAFTSLLTVERHMCSLYMYLSIFKHRTACALIGARLILCVWLSEQRKVYSYQRAYRRNRYFLNCVLLRFRLLCQLRSDP